MDEQLSDEALIWNIYSNITYNLSRLPWCDVLYNDSESMVNIKNKIQRYQCRSNYSNFIKAIRSACKSGSVIINSELMSMAVEIEDRIDIWLNQVRSILSLSMHMELVGMDQGRLQRIFSLAETLDAYKHSRLSLPENVRHRINASRHYDQVNAKIVNERRSDLTHAKESLLAAFNSRRV